MRVLVVGPHPPPSGGIATVVKNTLAMDFGADASTALFNPSTVPRPSNFLWRFANGVTARIPPRGFWALGTLWLLSAYRRALDRERPTVVHAHTSYGYGFWYNSLYTWIARRRGIGTILHFHGSRMDVFEAELGPVGRRLFASLIRVPDLGIALSEGWRSWYGKFIDPERLAVIPNCIPWSRFQKGPAADPERSPTLLFVGMQFAERKGIFDLVAVVPELLRDFPDMTIVLAGADDEGIEERLDVDDATRAALRFAGPLDAAGIDAAYREATVFTLPAYHEGMPMVMLEAMAAGLPVVCTRVNAIPEVVKDGENGILVEPGDRAGLAAALRSLLGDPDLRKRLGEAARETIRTRHDVERQVEWLEPLYRRVHRERGTR